ncbi:hypothetical protein SAMN05720766_10618 [Fibrobacter sp. UWH9]|nr:hypothetical protein SAMN05720766_10618 [Fibrobacter sp. UWH9]SHK60224.1 hypothetical protein SAMN05720765_103246 [Fibrobacter sp. UWH6]
MANEPQKKMSNKTAIALIIGLLVLCNAIVLLAR